MTAIKEMTLVSDNGRRIKVCMPKGWSVLSPPKIPSMSNKVKKLATLILLSSTLLWSHAEETSIKEGNLVE